MLIVITFALSKWKKISQITKNKKYNLPNPNQFLNIYKLVNLDLCCFNKSNC